MLNTWVVNVKNKTPKQPVLGIFGLFFHQKKLHFYHSGATKILFQKCKKHPNKKSDFNFFCCQTYRCHPHTGQLVQALVPTDTAIILCLNSVIFVLCRMTDDYKYKTLLSEIISDGFYTGNHRVLESQP